MLKQNPFAIGCIECDLVMTCTTELGAGHRIACPRCNHILARGNANPVDEVLAFSVTALIALLFSVGFSFLSFEINGQSNEVSLVSVLQQLYLSGFGVLAVIVTVFIVLLPMAYLCALVALTVRAKLKIKGTSSRVLANLICKIYPWTMVDVFIFGVLVALVKIVDMADVVIGVSFWSYAIFTVIFIRIAATVDTHQLWGWVDSDV